MNGRSFVQILSSVLFIFWGCVFGAIVFSQSGLGSLSHNLAHFITFWFVVVTCWVGYITGKNAVKIYQEKITFDTISKHDFLLLFFGALLLITGKLLFIVFIA
ncbi:MAG: hypothetical protein NTZ13_04220 [Candidatus Parcubacteria bacterium]|nr:hypothetical protein [Candidatus Parcubacteria bacterium]